MQDVVLAKVLVVASQFETLGDDVLLTAPVHVVDDHPDMISELVNFMAMYQVLTANETQQASFINDKLAYVLRFFLLFEFR